MASSLAGESVSDQKAARQAFERANQDEWHEVFSDSCTNNWETKWFLDGEVGAVRTGREGMQLSAGPRYGDDAHHMVLWSKDIFEGDLKIEFDYTRLDFETRCVNILYIQATGSGEGPYKKDISAWSELRRVPAMNMYFNHMNTYHISFSAFPLKGEKRKPYIRGRRYMPTKGGLKGTGLVPDYYPPESLFAPGVPHKVVVIKRGQDFYMRIENADEIYYCHMANPDLPPVPEGRIGLRHMYTRSARYQNFRISEPETSKKSRLPTP
jgi:hypothetical protein